MTQRLYLIRHAKPDVAVGLCYGQTDVPVRAASQADLYANIQAHVPTGLPALSSPLRRCQELALQLRAEAFFSLLVIEPDLRELSFGEWEGQRWDDIPSDQINAWISNFAAYTPPGGESVEQARIRLLRAATVIEQMINESQSDCAVIAHAGSIKLLIQHWCGLEDAWLQANRIDYGSVTVLVFEHDQPATIEQWNLR